MRRFSGRFFEGTVYSHYKRKRVCVAMEPSTKIKGVAAEHGHNFYKCAQLEYTLPGVLHPGR